jgi:histidinol-phosphate aminotransferase
MYEINGVAVHFGCYLLDHMDIVDAYVQEVDEGRTYLAEQMKELGFAPFDTHANFMLIAIEDAELRKSVGAYLGDRDILIAGKMNPPLEKCIRISIGTKAQMAVVVGHIRALKEASGR